MKIKIRKVFIICYVLYDWWEWYEKGVLFSVKVYYVKIFFFIILGGFVIY